MERRIVNPWTWQDQVGVVQANETRGGNLETVLSEAGFALADVVRLTDG